MNTVLCLHSSASSSRQWRQFRATIGDEYRVLTPDLCGYGGESFAKTKRFSLDDEVDRVLDQIGESAEPIHVVGHSYGGAVALRFASRFPYRVKSLTLYEPAECLLLFEEGLHTDEACEIRGLREVFMQQSRSIFFRWFAAREYINYWSGKNAWRGMRHHQKRRVVSVVPKIAAEWDALFSSSASLGDGSQFSMPVRILCGTRTKCTARRTAELLEAKIATASLQFVEGLSHMGPVTHAELVNSLIREHVLSSDATRQRIASMRQRIAA